jgi:1-pyrroline-5-carboxylate dehydrogenase
LAIANDTQYGLTGGVYSNNRAHLELARRDFHVGNLYLNRKITGAMVGVQPFGGYNMSGTCAKAGGRDYLLLFTQMKVIVERF